MITVLKEYFTLLEQRRIKEAEEYRASTIPKTLFKFIALSNNDESNSKRFYSLKDNQAWVAPITCLNDPYEFSCMYIDKKRLLDAGYSDSDVDSFNRLFTSLVNRWDVLSLSNADIDCLPMWAYYTNNYKGFCIEYEVENPSAIFPISYEPNRVPVARLIIESLRTFKEMFDKGDKSSPDAEFYASVMRYQMFMKHESWKHEKEYRIIYPHNAKAKHGRNVNISDLGLKTKRVIAGLYCTDVHKDKLNKISNELGCGDIYCCNTSNEQFTLITNR